MAITLPSHGRGRKWLWIVGGLAVAAAIVGGVVAATGGSDKKSSAPYPSWDACLAAPHSTYKQCVKWFPDEANSPSSHDDAGTTTTTDAPAYTPGPSDFKLDVVTLSKQCFGSAGCNVTYRIQVTYTGPETPDPTRTFDVIYNVTGAESTITNHFTVTGTSVSTQASEFTSTNSDGAVLVATATSVLPE